MTVDGVFLLREERREFGIQSIEKLLHGCRSFISHVGDAEGFPLDFSVSAVDRKRVFVLHGFDPATLVEVIGGDEAGEGEGAESFRWQVLEAVFRAPGMDHGIIRGMTGVAGLKAFSHHDINALFQGVEVWDGRSGRGVVSSVILGEFAEVKVVSAVFDSCGALKGFLRSDKTAKPGGRAIAF